MAMPGFMDDAVKMAKTAMSKNLHSNDAINKIDANNPAGFLQGVPATVINMKKGDGFMDAVKNAHRTKNSAGQETWNAPAIAGSFIAAGVGYRALSGGGAYRDSNGNTNVAGIPFI